PYPNPRSLEPVWSLIDRESKRLLRATFQLSRERISKLKKELIPKTTNLNYLSSFVVTLAHTVVCIVKSKRGNQLRGDDATIQLRGGFQIPIGTSGAEELLRQLRVAFRGGAESGVRGGGRRRNCVCGGGDHRKDEGDGERSDCGSEAEAG
ncbi:hypothetical protein LINGRAHAP2_LOCUS23527, partial [Linum grandiflorum]